LRNASIWHSTNGLRVAEKCRQVFAAKALSPPPVGELEVLALHRERADFPRGVVPETEVMAVDVNLRKEHAAIGHSTTVNTAQSL
jgi:hypothetical protein